MRHGNVGRWSLALALSLGGLGAAHADPPARWWERVLPRTSARKIEPDAAKVPVIAPGPSLGVQLSDALGTWQRRQEICQKLQEIAHENGDDELWRKADQLHQRAWDVYSRQTGKMKGSGGVGLDESVLQSRLGGESADARAKLTAPTAQARRMAGGAGQAALREE